MFFVFYFHKKRWGVFFKGKKLKIASIGNEGVSIFNLRVESCHKHAVSEKWSPQEIRVCGG